MLHFQILISQISGPELMFGLAVLFAIYLYTKNYRKDFFIIFLTSTGAMATSFILKHLLKVPRPEHMLVIEDGYRFPSGHATMAAVVMSLGIYYAHKHIQSRPLRLMLYVCAVGWYLLISYSRLYLNVHYPIDVIAGGAIGIIATIIALYVVNYFSRQK